MGGRAVSSSSEVGDIACSEEGAEPTVDPIRESGTGEMM